MILSRHQSAKQLPLFDYPIEESDHGYARHVVGELIEEISALVLGGYRHKTDSRCDYCPDLSVPDWISYNPALCMWQTGMTYFECKAAGLSRQTFIYEGRLKKDRCFAKRFDLKYLIWHHTAKTKQARSVFELRSLLLQRIVCAYLVPFSVIDSICQGLSIEKLNSAYGHSDSNPVYGSGVRIPIKALEAYRFIEWEFHSQNLQGTV